MALSKNDEKPFNASKDTPVNEKGKATFFNSLLSKKKKDN